MRSDQQQKASELQILQQQLLDAHKKIEHLEKQQQINEVEALLKKQHAELVSLRTENIALKAQNALMKKQIERLSTLVYSAVPKRQAIEPTFEAPHNKNHKP